MNLESFRKNFFQQRKTIIPLLVVPVGPFEVQIWIETLGPNQLGVAAWIEFVAGQTVDTVGLYFTLHKGKNVPELQEGVAGAFHIDTLKEGAVMVTSTMIINSTHGKASATIKVEWSDNISGDLTETKADTSFEW